jgi:hypothetical protein
MAVEPDGHTALVFSNQPGESDYHMVDLWKGERKDTKRLHGNPSAAAFSSDGLRTFVTLSGGNDSPPSAQYHRISDDEQPERVWPHRCR